ncbi:Signal transduction histidine kinase [Candidatus Terasakiella magnetica]|uniref:histidine kinase n=1 Tax=Candidatus Terasakiella magnetica TaxID=1867952 RepID=A0A1C3RI34_9PROT|nr:ATP-binding protein [Candidatus Terasakiella magnetica]SCA56947.1 Signal transduction histidine kinase [Candidatus Terasakiella magnetica]
MRFIPQTMLGRTLAIVIGLILLVQIGGGIVHYREWRNFTENAERTQLIERMATYVKWMNAATPLQRKFLLQSNRLSGMRVWQSKTSSIHEPSDWFGVESFVRKRLAKKLGGIDEKRIRVEDAVIRGGFKDRFYHRDDDDDDDEEHEWREHRRHMFEGRQKPKILVAVRLDDRSWLNMKVAYEGLGKPVLPPFVLPFFVMTIVIALLAIFIMRRANKPLSMMATAADRLGRDVNAPPMEETGPREVREAAHAFNEMQTRLRRFVQDRTHMLAAISHDLRTPITRMRLRAEFVDDDQQREKMLADLDEMESMIAATMAFARDDVANEAVSQIDLAALVESLCEDMRETGGDVTYEGMDELAFKGRPVGLKRAVSNLVGNALKYGTACTVSLAQEEKQVVICVRDDGPGIPEADLEEVFQPFRRVEASRNKETGGVGLGLAVVRSVAHAHGGTAELRNCGEGGLEAKLILPV